MKLCWTARHDKWCAFVVMFILIAAVSVDAQPKPTTPQRGPQAGPSAPRRLPLDPLTEDEKRAAERIALAEPRVQQLLGAGRRQLVSVELFVMKPPQEQIEAAAAGRAIAMGRFAEVIFFRPEGEFGVRAVVELPRGAVAVVDRLESQQVPLTQVDLAEAWQLASRDAEVRQALGADVDRFRVQGAPVGGVAARPRYAVEALPVEAVAENDPCYKHRCLHLLFRRGDAYLMGPVVVVDLSARKVYVERRAP